MNIHEKLYEDLTERIIKLSIEAHKTLGPGFMESVYENALIYEMKKEGLKFEEQKIITIPYKETVIGEHRLDVVVEDKIIVELKAVKNFEDIHMAQIISYMKASGKRVGLLLNFGKKRLEIKRVVL